ncbi:hypothetical protein ACUN29_16205 [Streptomyces sp. WC2508]|uniref:hypothetical protein n=1 Tax=Streptomyces sp. WC2508 TaxID=3461405 RepID=UPI004043E258
MRTAVVSGVSVYGAAGDVDGEELDGSEPEPLDPLGFAGDCARMVVDALARLGFRIDGGRAHLDVPSSDLRERLVDVGAGVGGGPVVIHHVGHGLVGRHGNLRLPGPDWSPKNPAATSVDVDAIIRDFEDNPEGPDVLLLLDVCQAGAAARAQASWGLGDTERRVWVIGATGHRDDASDGRFSRAVAATLDRLGSGALEVHSSQEYVPPRVFAAEVQHELDRMRAQEGTSLPQRIEMTPQFHPVDCAPAFFANPRFGSGRGDLTASVREPTLAAFLLHVDRGLDPVHYLSRDSGVPELRSATGQCYFTGRKEQLAQLSAWLDGAPGQQGTLRVVTGSPGVGKSALVGVLVCAAHPQLRQLAAGVTPRVRADLLPSINDRLIAVHARGLSLVEVIDSLARQLGLEQPDGKGWTPRDFCFEAVHAPAGVPVVVVDALDEATEPQAIFTDLLLPLSRMAGRAGQRCRLLVGARSWKEFEPLFGAARECEGGLVDLDRVRPEQLREELSEYVYALLAAQATLAGPEHRTFRTEAAGVVADALVGASVVGAFLVAGLCAHLLATLPAEHRTTAAVASLVPRSPGEVLELQLRQLDADQAWLRPVLAALGRAKGEGMPLRLLARAAAAFGPQADDPSATPSVPSDEAVEDVLRLVFFFLRTAAGPDGVTVYRFFHQALADHMAAHPYGPGDTADRRAASIRLYEALRDAASPAPGHRPDWSTAEPYLLRHLVEHATEAAGVWGAEELIRDSEYLVHADPRHLVPLLDVAEVGEAALLAHAYRTSGLLHLTASPSQRRQLLAVDVARWGHRWEARQVLQHPGAPPPAWLCVGATGSGIRISYAGSLRGHEEAAREILVARTSQRWVVSLGEDRSVRVWDMATSEPLATADADADALGTVVVGGVEVVAALTPGGDVRLWELPTLRPWREPFMDPTGPVADIYTFPVLRRPCLVTRSSSGVVRMWNLEEGRPQGKPSVVRDPRNISPTVFGRHWPALCIDGGNGREAFLIWDEDAGEFTPWAREGASRRLSRRSRRGWWSYGFPGPASELDLEPSCECVCEHQCRCDWECDCVRDCDCPCDCGGRDDYARWKRRQDIERRAMSLLPTSSAAFATTVFRDEPTVLVAQPDGPIHLWRLYSDQVALTDGQGHHGLVTEVTYDQGQTVSRADDDTLLHDGVIQRLTGLSAVARAVLPGGRAVALAAAAQGRLSVLDGKWAERRRRRIARYPSRVSQILSVGDARFVSSAGRHLRHWQLSSHASGQYAAEYFWSRRLPAPATAMALLPDGLLVTTVDGGVAVLDLDSGCVSSDGGQCADRRVVGLAVVGPAAVVLTEDGALELWEEPTSPKRRPLHVAGAPATCVAALPGADRPLVVTGHEDRTLRVLDIGTGRPVGPRMWLPDVPRAVAAADERHLAVGCGSDVVRLEWLAGDEAVSTS